MNTFDNLLALLFDDKKPRLWVYMLLITIFFAKVLSSADYDLKNGMYFQARSIGKAYSNYKEFNLPGGNHFISGIGGQLFWHPKNFTEALLLGTANENDFLNIFQIILLYGFIGIFYFMTKNSGGNKFFSSNIYYGFLLIGVLTAVSGMLISMEQSWVNHYFQKITGGQFSLQLSGGLSFFYYTVGLMFLFLLQFPQKALDMQKEQELTI